MQWHKAACATTLKRSQRLVDSHRHVLACQSAYGCGRLAKFGGVIGWENSPGGSAPTVGLPRCGLQDISGIRLDAIGLLLTYVLAPTKQIEIK